MKQLLGVAPILLFAGSAYANSIAVKNASFEDPVQAAGAWTNTRAGGAD